MSDFRDLVRSISGHGYLVIETGEGLGDPGDCLVNLGGGRAAWRPCP